MAIEIILLLFIAGLVAGAINAIAGGATLFTFPVLMAAGLPPTVANASNFVAMLPGNAAAIPAYASELGENKRETAWLVVATLAGGAVGSTLLILSTDTFFLELVPWLILIATLIYAFGERINAQITNWVGGPGSIAGAPGYFLVFLFSIYGGYFGAALGIIILAVLKIMGYLDFHKANAVKNLTNTAISLLGVAIFAYGDLIAWPEALVMMAGAAVGGYSSAHFARRVPQGFLNKIVIVMGFILSAYYFLK